MEKECSTNYIRERLGILYKKDMKKLTQRELAELFEIPYRTVTNWDNRKCMPEWMENIVNALVDAESSRQVLEAELVKAGIL